MLIRMKCKLRIYHLRLTIFIISSFFRVVFLWSCCCYARKVCHTMSAHFFHVRFVYLVTVCPKFTYRAEKMNCLFMADIHRVVDGLKRVACFWWTVQHQIEKWLRAQTVNDVMGNKAVFRPNDEYACWRKKRTYHTRDNFVFKKKKDSLSKKKTLAWTRFQRHQFAAHWFDLLFASGETVYSVDIFLISTLGCCALNNKANFYNDNSLLLCFLYSREVRKLFICLWDALFTCGSHVLCPSFRKINSSFDLGWLGITISI